METQNNYQEKLIRVAALSGRLMPQLPYHNIDHAFEVYSSVCRLANLEKVSYENKFLLQTAALLHDTLYELNNSENEKTSASVARTYLPGFGYSSDQTEQIADLILATQIPTNPKNLLEKIMCDADLDNLGREDCFGKGHKYRQELGIPKNKWNPIQLKFLENHIYYTASAKKLRNHGKQKNIEKLKKLIGGSHEK